MSQRFSGNDWRLLKRLIRIVREESKYLWLVIALVPVGILASVLQPYLIKLTIDEAVVKSNAALLPKYCGTYLALVCLGYFATTVGDFGLQYAGMKTLRQLRSRLFGHIMRQGQSFFDKRTTGALMTRTTNDVDAVYESIAWGGIGLLTDGLAILSTIIIMLSMDWRLTLIVIAFSPLIVFIVNVFRKRIRVLFAELRQVLSELNGFFAEQIHGMTEVQLYRSAFASKTRFKTKAGHYLRLQKAANWWDAGLYSIMDGLSALAVGVMIISVSSWIGVGDEGVTLGLVVAFVDYLTRIFVPIRDFSGKFAIIQRALTALERIFELIDTDEMIRGGTKTLTTKDHAIRYRNVSFRYRDEGPTILHNIELDIDPGEVVAIVGATGSGKTTLGRLLMRQYTGYDGTITIGGDAIESIALPDLRALISVVHQDSFLFDGTVEENIKLWSDSVNEETLQRAAKAAKLSTLSQNGDNFLARKITERGENLSAGERQLVSIARALARPSPVVILDEATANVDSRTEQQIDDAIDALVEQKTMIIIAHRLSTIMKADRIIVMRQGRVVEMGNHETLLNKGGYYANLVESGLQGTMKPEPTESK